MEDYNSNQLPQETALVGSGYGISFLPAGGQPGR